jgi:hypothetical protein
MRKLLLAGLCLIVNCTVVFAQNKTLGVGVSAPNPNAALHVESPTGNQGFIMPRLTTAQRNAMVSLLTQGDKGLILYDTDLNSIFIWDGLAWKSSGQFTNDNPASTQDGISVVTKGLGSAGRFTTDNTKSKMPTLWAQTNSDSALSAPIYGLNTGKGDVAGSFRISNAASTFGALYGETNGTGSAVFGNQLGLGRAAQFQIQNASNDNAAIRGFTNGTGYAGFYTISNAANASAGIFSTTNGTGAAIFGESTGTGSAGKFVVNNVSNNSVTLWAETNSNQPLSAAIYGRNTGTGDAAASFRIQNAANSFSAAYAETNGTGPALFGNQLGTGVAGQFQIQNGSNSNAAVRGFTNGTGYAGFYTINNLLNTSAGIFSQTNGKGAAILGESTGTGSAGKFVVNNTSSASPALWAETNSNNSLSAPIYGLHTGLGDNAAVFRLSNPSNAYAAVYATTSGPGAGLRAENTGSGNGFAATFDVTNTTNQFPAVQVSNAGPAAAVRVMQPKGTGSGLDIYMQNASSPGFGVYVDQGGVGHAGSFNISNGSNSSNAVQAITKGGGSAGQFETANPANTAPTISASHQGDGIAFAIWRGGMMITTEVVKTLSITKRAAAYQILPSGGTTFTLDFGPKDGEVFMVYNETNEVITVAGVPFNMGEGKVLIVFPGGAVRGL